MTPAEIEQGRRLVERMRSKGAESWAALLDDGADTIDRLLDAYEAAVAALKPFAEAADDLDDKHGDHGEIWEASAAMSITAGDLRHARALLSGGGA